MIDTHAHLYLPEFENDFSDIVQRASAVGITEIWLPAIDAASLQEMEQLRTKGPFRLFAGLHPCEVKENYLDELSSLREQLNKHRYDGIGEIGLDLYWNKTFFEHQCQALTTQFEWALEFDLPVALHVRNAFDEILPIIRPYFSRGLSGIFHSFSGTLEQAKEVVEAGFLLGINGVVTFKKSHLPELLAQIPLTAIVLETDAPYLTPAPHRGKRNESSYVPFIASKLSEIYHCSLQEIDEVTTRNALSLFR